MPFSLRLFRSRHCSCLCSTQGPTGSRPESSLSPPPSPSLATLVCPSARPPTAFGAATGRERGQSLWPPPGRRQTPTATAVTAAAVRSSQLSPSSGGWAPRPGPALAAPGQTRPALALMCRLCASLRQDLVGRDPAPEGDASRPSLRERLVPCRSHLAFDPSKLMTRVLLNHQ